MIFLHIIIYFDEFFQILVTAIFDLSLFEIYFHKNGQCSLVYFNLFIIFSIYNICFYVWEHLISS